MQRYNPKDIEPKWQKNWDSNKTYQANLNSDKPKYIAMSMFNYPSGAGIHIGHAMNYTISDVKARFKRQQGYDSYHPVGWDAFGLPAENYAIKAGVSPQESMATIIPSYHKQYKAMGWSNDWSKEIATHEPGYYKWSQWIFTQMYRNGLAYQDSRLQWWCIKCQTVLANEQVIDGRCWRHDAPDDPVVEQKEVKQWFFKITEYADELLESIDSLDWTESVKLAQKNWIGRSEGATVEFKLKGLGADDEVIKVFTTAHDTIYGVTFMVLAPEHPVIARCAQYADNAQDIEEYVAGVTRKNEVERLADKNKHGIQIEGLTAINPINGAEVPIWTADYVLISYGTGAVMAVPGEDERDYEFANKYDLPVIYITSEQQFIPYSEEIKPNRNKYKLANSGGFDGMNFEAGRKAILAKLIADGTGEATTHYKMRDWSVSRQRYWGAPIPIINCEECGPVLVSDDQLPVILPELDDFKPSGDGRSALARAKDWLSVPCPECGGKAERETDTLDTYIDSSWYMYRYLDPSNENEIFDSNTVKKWEPIDFYNGADHATAHLLYARFIGHFFKKLGLIDEPEPFKQFLFNGKVTASDGTMFSKSKGNGVDPLEIINQGYGADALRTYLMFAAPLELWIKWDPQGVPSTYRFLSRVWNLVQEYLDSEQGETPDETQKAIRRTTHTMIKKITEDIESNRYNTAIAAAMTALNELYRQKADHLRKNDIWDEALGSLVCCIAPFAPHISEELWRQLGHQSSVHVGTWPAWDEQYLALDATTIAVQVNGKLRGEVVVPSDANEQMIKQAALELENVQQHVGQKEPARVIYVPGRLVNVVIK